MEEIEAGLSAPWPSELMPFSLGSGNVSSGKSSKKGRAYWTVVLQQLRVRASAVENHEAFNQVLCLAPESLGDMHLVRFALRILLGKLLVDFFLAEGVVHELLRRLSTVYKRRKDVVQAKLTGEHVHHDVHNPSLLLGRAGGDHRRPISPRLVIRLWLRFERTAVQDI